MSRPCWKLFQINNGGETAGELKKRGGGESRQEDEMGMNKRASGRKRKGQEGKGGRRGKEFIDWRFVYFFGGCLRIKNNPR